MTDLKDIIWASSGGKLPKGGALFAFTPWGIINLSDNKIKGNMKKIQNTPEFKIDRLESELATMKVENEKLREVLFYEENVIREEYGCYPYTEQEFNAWLKQKLEAK